MSKPVKSAFDGLRLLEQRVGLCADRGGSGRSTKGVGTGVNRVHLRVSRRLERVGFVENAGVEPPMEQIPAHTLAEVPRACVEPVRLADGARQLTPPPRTSDGR